MKKRVVLTGIIVGSIAALTALVGLSMVGIRKAQEESLLHSTKDALRMIAGSVANEIRAGRHPSPAEIEKLARVLIDGRVINASFDSNGKPADLYGTAFRVTANGSAVTASSAGPDRVFGTEDDIEITASTNP